MKLTDAFANAAQFWERNRILYNLVLAAVTLAISWRELIGIVNQPPAQAFGMIVVVAGFALLANLVYCMAYLPDVAIQMTPFGKSWRHYRWALFGAGLLLASWLVYLVLCSPDPM